MASATESRPKRAAIYVRVSTVEQARHRAGGKVDGTVAIDDARLDEGTVPEKDKKSERETSLDTQEAACRAFAAEHGYTVAEEHVFREVYSGAAL